MKKLYAILILAFFFIALSAQTVWINEVWYDTPYSSDSLAFVELKGTPGLALDTFTVYGINGNGGVVYYTISLAGCTIPADSYFVIGDIGTVANVDLINSLVDFQNGPDNIMLGTTGALIIDAMGYGDFDGAVFTGLDFPTYDVYNKYSLSRLYHTDINYYDYVPLANITPGEHNGTYMFSTINAIQLDSWTGSALADSTVHIWGMVTAIFMDDSSYCLQSGTGAWNGVEVWKDMMADSYAIGDSVIIVGVIYEYNSKTVVEYGASAKGHTGNTPVATVITAGSAGEEYEGQLVQLNYVTVLTAPDGFGEWLVLDLNGDTLKIGDRSANYTVPSIGDILYSITGILDYSFAEFKLEPRSDADIVFGYDLGGVIGLSDNPADSSGTIVECVEMALYDTTDASGAYMFGTIPADTYTLILTHTGYVTDTINAVFTGTETFDRTLAVETYTLSGIIGLSDNPADSSGTEVYCVELPATDTTDATGYYEFLGLPPESYTLIVSHAGYITDTINAVFTGSETFNMTLIYDASGITSEDARNLPVISELRTDAAELSFIYNKKTADNADIGIYDLTGRTLFSRNISDGPGTYSVSLNREFPKGIYFISIREGSDNFIKKFVIVR